jgi:hypothetical protein
MGVLRQFKDRIIFASILAILFFVLSVPAYATGCAVSSGSWMNSPLSQTETGIFRATFDATPSSSAIDGATGLSAGPASAYTNLAVIIRFNNTGHIDARNGGTYTSATSIPYSGGTTYHFILDVKVAAHTYNAYVMIGSVQTTIGLNLAFRTEQAGVSSLSNLGAMTTIGSHTICNVALAVPPTITTQPASRTVIAGQTAAFSVAEIGTAPMAYHWMKNGVTISGANSSTYTIPPATSLDNNSKFTVAVSNSLGSATSGAATLTVNAATALLNGNQVGLSFGNVTLPNKSSQSVTIINAGTSNVTISNVSISGPGFGASGISTGSILTPGQTATLDVTFAPAATGTVKGSVTVTSSATNSPDTIALLGTGVTQIQHSVSLSWNASTSTVIGYNIYRTTVSGGPYTKLNVTPMATTSYTDSTVQSGTGYDYAVTSVETNNVETAFSNQASAVIS